MRKRIFSLTLLLALTLLLGALSTGAMAVEDGAAVTALGDTGARAAALLAVKDGASLTASGTRYAAAAGSGFDLPEDYAIRGGESADALQDARTDEMPYSEYFIFVGEDNTEDSAAKYAVIAPAAPSHSHPICGAACAHVGDETHAAVDFDKALTAEMVNGDTGAGTYTLSEGNYYLAGDIETEKKIKVSGNVNLCFNGHTITYNGGSYQGAFITLQSGATFNTCDCQSGGGIKDTRSVAGNTKTRILEVDLGSEAALYGGAFNSMAAHGQGGVHVTYSGKLTVDGADITTKSNTLYAQQGSQLTIKSGTLKADQPSDGAVVTHSTGFIMEGGTITTDTDHTGVYFAKHGSGGGDNAGNGGGTISGGTIKAGTGIQVIGDQSVVTLSGAPDIDAGTDIWFATQTENLLQVGDDLAGKFSVKYNFTIDEDSPYTFTALADADQSDHFTSADTSLSIRDVVDEATGKHAVQLYKPGTQSHSHPVCGKTCAHVGDETHEAVTYTALTQDVVDEYEVQHHSSSILGESYEYITIPAGRYYLEENITTDKMIKLGGNVDLCFNGHTFTSTFGNTSSQRGALMLSDNAVFNACDCRGGGGFTSDGEFGLVTHYNEGVNCTVNLYGGTFTGRCPVSLGSTTGGTLTLDGATLNATDTALSTNGKVTIKSGSITSSGSYAVNVGAGDLTVTGGTIRNTGGYYHALRVVSPKPVKLSGSPVIQGGSQGDICLLYSTCKLEVGGLAGTYRVAAGSAVREDTPWVITTPATEDQSGCFTSAASGVGVRDVVGEDGKHTVQLYKTHTHAVSVGCETTGGAQVTFQALTSENGALYVDGAAAEVSSTYKAYMLPAGNYYLAGDVRLDKQIRLTSQAQGADPANSTVNFCLNGYKLEYAGDHNYSPVIYVGTNAYALNICDCNPTGTDRTGNVINDPVSGYTKVIWGGVITGGRYAGVTGGDAPLTLYSGTIAGNGWAQASTSVYGGGVDADNFVMCGGAIMYNMATYGGGVNATGSFTMTGGTISGNWAKTNNGGVHTVISSGTPASVTLSGSAKITGNVMGNNKTTASNLNLVKDCVVTVGPEGLGEAFQVGISTSTVPTASAPVTVAQGSGGTALTAADLEKFSSDNSKYELKLSSGKIILAVKPAHVHSWATAWSKDANGHWHACTAQGCGITDYANCGEAGAAYAAHVYDDDQDATCNTCGYNRADTPPTPDQGEVKGEVERKPGAPAVTVDKEVLKELAGEAQQGETVTVKLTVEKKEAPTDKADIEAVVTGDKGNVLYLDLSLLKQVNDQTPQAITDTGARVLEIVVPYDFTGKKDVTVYRKHGGDPAQVLTRLAAKPAGSFSDGGFFADAEGGKVYIYASKFSTYAIGYTEEVPEPAPSGAFDNYYTLTAAAGEGGAISPKGKVTVQQGTRKTFTITPDEGYVVADVLVDGESVGAVESYVFRQVSRRHTIEAVFQRAGDKKEERPAWNPFEDVKAGDWFHDDVRYVYEQGLMVGTDESHFRPEWDTSRAMIATIIWRLAGSPESKAGLAYPDCVKDSWYAAAVAWGTEHGVVKGYDNGSFGPEDPITREQLAVMLWRYAGSPKAESGLSAFADADRAGSWAVDGLGWAVEAGILRGKDGGRLDPTGRASRAEAATMLTRYLESGK